MCVFAVFWGHDFSYKCHPNDRDTELFTMNNARDSRE